MTSSGKWLRNSFIWLVLALVIVLIIVLFFHSSSDTTSVNVSTILNDIQTDISKNQTDNLSVGTDTITLTRGQNGPKEAANINDTFDITKVLKDNGIDYTNNKHLVLQYGYTLKIPIPDLKVSDWGVRATLSFSRSGFQTAVPWSAVFVSSGLQRLQARNPASRAAAGMSKNRTRSRRGRRLGHDGRQ